MFGPHHRHPPEKGRKLRAALGLAPTRDTRWGTSSTATDLRPNHPIQGMVTRAQIDLPALAIPDAYRNQRWQLAVPIRHAALDPDSLQLLMRQVARQVGVYMDHPTTENALHFGDHR